MSAVISIDFVFLFQELVVFSVGAGPHPGDVQLVLNYTGTGFKEESSSSPPLPPLPLPPQTLQPLALICPQPSHSPTQLYLALMRRGAGVVCTKLSIVGTVEPFPF